MPVYLHRAFYKYSGIMLTIKLVCLITEHNVQCHWYVLFYSHCYNEGLLYGILHFTRGKTILTFLAVRRTIMYSLILNNGFQIPGE